MNDEIRLSILIACHDRTPYFAEMLDSFLQSGYHFRRTELLICDDASPAGGDGDTARAYAGRHPALIRVFRKDDGEHGPGRSLDHILPQARGKYLLIFDADDVFIRFDLDGNMAYLDAHPEAAGISGKKRLFNADGDLVQNFGGDYSDFVGLTLPCPVPNAIVLRKSDVLAAGGFREIPGLPIWDIFLWTRLALKKHLLFDNNYRLFYRIHREQITSRRQEMFAAAYEWLTQYVAGLHPDLHDALTHGRTLTVTPETRVPFLMLCGRLVETGAYPLEYKLALLDAARRVAPEDYAVGNCKARLLKEAGRATEALAENMQLLLRHPGQPYIEILAWQQLIRLGEENGIDVALFRARERQELEKFFELTPDQREQFSRTLANAQQYAREDQSTSLR